ncbi:MAG TPA: PEGA domain-containing protein [Terriglobales bacterium]|nr:PEGA domain-containing protein [Terriglobales bacterium]
MISPHLKEKSRFKDLLGIISAFITGFLLSKINATIDKQIDAILTNPIFIGQMLLFGSSFLLGALFVFVGRQYWRDEDEYQAVSTVQVASNPDGADVYSDGAFVGNAPSTLKLSPGKHTVRVTSSGYKDWSREITVQPGSEVKLNAVLEKEQVPTLRKEREGWGTPS